jgi:hypothetical protein
MPEACGATDVATLRKRGPRDDPFLATPKNEKKYKENVCK